MADDIAREAGRGPLPPPPRIEGLRVEQWPIERLVEYPSNPRKNDGVVDRMCGALQEYGFRIPIVAKSDGVVVDGHLRLKAALKLGLKTVPVALADELTDVQIKAFRLLANQSANWAEWDFELLKMELNELAKMEFDLTLTGFPELELVQFMSGLGAGTQPQTGLGSLAEKFGVPPFSVLNAREGWWQDRKRAWIALGIQSELGRGENLIGRSPQELFCHLTGIPYDKARAIVTEAMAAEGEAFDLHALVAKHGGRKTVRGGGDFSRVTMSETVQRLKPSADQALKNSRARAHGEG